MSLRRLTIAAAIAGTLSVTPSGQAQSSIPFVLCNQSSHVIQGVYVSPSDQEDWGQNNLPTAPGLYPNQWRVFSIPGLTCLPHDLRLVADGDTEYLDEEVEFCPPAGGGAYAFIVLDREIQKVVVNLAVNPCGAQ